MGKSLRGKLSFSKSLENSVIVYSPNLYVFVLWNTIDNILTNDSGFLGPYKDSLTLFELWGASKYVLIQQNPFT